MSWNLSCFPTHPPSGIYPAFLQTSPLLLFSFFFFIFFGIFFLLVWLACGSNCSLTLTDVGTLKPYHDLLGSLSSCFPLEIGLAIRTKSKSWNKLLKSVSLIYWLSLFFFCWAPTPAMTPTTEGWKTKLLTYVGFQIRTQRSEINAARPSIQHSCNSASS